MSQRPLAKPLAKADSDYTSTLKALMGRAGIPSLRALCRQTGVSRWQVQQLCRGNLLQVRLLVLLALSRGLGLSLGELLAHFGYQDEITAIDEREVGFPQGLQAEYERLQQRLDQQQTELERDFQARSLDRLESLLTQLPTALDAIEQNPQLAAARILKPLLRPLDQLLGQWQVEPMDAVGTILPYDPQVHQLMGGSAQVGDRVKVRNRGYYWRGQLWHRAKVSPI